jgi:hypothetical protein
MPGLMSRILSRRADGAPPPADAPPAEQPTVVVPAQTAGEEVAPEQATPVGVPASGDGNVGEVSGPGVEANAAEAAQQTEVVPAVDDATVTVEGLPAAAEPEPDPSAPSFRNRGALRRRLRYLRRVREIAFRDLGGLVFDLDRFGRERPDLVRLKLDGLRAIDAELRGLEDALGDIRAVEELHEPGIAACATCGALHGSDARFCSACGTAVDAPAPAAAEAPAAAPAEAVAQDAPPTDAQPQA